MYLRHKLSSSHEKTVKNGVRDPGRKIRKAESPHDVINPDLHKFYVLTLYMYT